MRRVRDYLESKNHQPLLFFLKCIRDTDELDSLIKREIEARTIFLLCDSPNSRSAQWVQREVEFIQSLRDRHYTVIDVTAPWPAQQVVLDRLSQHSTLFLSYAHSDANEVSAIYEALCAYDYSISSTDAHSERAMSGVSASNTRSTNPFPRVSLSSSPAHPLRRAHRHFSLPSFSAPSPSNPVFDPVPATSFQFSSVTVPHQSSWRRTFQSIRFSTFVVCGLWRRQSAFTKLYAASLMNPTATPNHVLQQTAGSRSHFNRCSSWLSSLTLGR